ncbi:WD repeat-containing protein 55-like [Pocillopora verrucosa]|uniref:WD repeat-containing protein 55-like n=1 Tax=Pocillopora verrucosa TaxID=203993 RepID=UPI003341C96B
MAAQTNEHSHEGKDGEDDVPDDISFDNQVFDLSFHPNRDVIAAGEIDGRVTVHSYSVSEENHLLLELHHHKKACRALTFSLDGLYLYTGSKDKSLQAVDMNSGAVAHSIVKAHNSPVYCMKVITDSLLATGDDDGCVKFWDTRQTSCVMTVADNQDFISDMDCDAEKRTLLAASGDGSLSVFNIRRQKIEQQSDNMESELLSVAVVKSGRKVVCGTGDGILNLFTWGEWGDITDRFPGHPLSIDSCVAVSDNIVCTGSMDGIIRAVHILPNRFVGTVGEHKDFPVERMRISSDGNTLASCSHDQSIKFWDVSHLKTLRVDPSGKKKRETPTKKATDDFFADL